MLRLFGRIAEEEEDAGGGTTLTQASEGIIKEGSES